MPARHDPVRRELAQYRRSDPRLRRPPRAGDAGAALTAAGIDRRPSAGTRPALTMRCGRAIAAALLLLVFAPPRPAVAQTLQEVAAGAVWGENDSDLLRRFGRAAT